MKFVKQNDIYVVYVQKGDELIQTLTDFARQEGLKGAAIQGIGALQDVELGYYNAETREYQRKVYPEDMELISALGNVTTLEDGNPFVHIHVSLGLPDYSVIGGHCFAANVAVVGEFFVTPLTEIPRHQDDAIGLKCWNLGHCSAR